MDVAYTSLLKRAQQTLDIVLKITGQEDVPVHQALALALTVTPALALTLTLTLTQSRSRSRSRSRARARTLTLTLALNPSPNPNHSPNVHQNWRLNERMYGGLTGLNKKETVEKYGAEQVGKWRRSYDTPPPPIETDSPYWPGNDNKYAHIAQAEIPLSECLKDTVECHVESGANPF